MHFVTLWSRNSTNFNANQFVVEHGTSTIVLNSQNDALRVMGIAINTPGIDKATFNGPRGCLTWKQNQPDADDVRCDKYDYHQNDHPDIDEGCCDREDDVDTSDPEYDVN